MFNRSQFIDYLTPKSFCDKYILAIIFEYTTGYKDTIQIVDEQNQNELFSIEYFMDDTLYNIFKKFCLTPYEDKFQTARQGLLPLITVNKYNPIFGKCIEFVFQRDMFAVEQPERYYYVYIAFDHKIKQLSAKQLADLVHQLYPHDLLPQNDIRWMDFGAIGLAKQISDDEKFRDEFIQEIKRKFNRATLPLWTARHYLSDTTHNPRKLACELRGLD